MASYGGVGIFGAAVSMTTSDNPREAQINSFFGINGLEALDGGFRGRITKVHGVLYGQSALLLSSAEGLFRSYNDGVARMLVDSLGTVWPSVRLLTFQPSGRVGQAADGTYFRAYQAQFLHLA
jgi:hypothetical protein